MAASRVQQFLEQAGCRKRAAPAGGEQPPAAKQALLPVYLFLEHGKLEAREVSNVCWGLKQWDQQWPDGLAGAVGGRLAALRDPPHRGLSSNDLQPQSRPAATAVAPG